MLLWNVRDGSVRILSLHRIQFFFSCFPSFRFVYESAFSWRAFLLNRLYLSCNEIHWNCDEMLNCCGQKRNVNCWEMYSCCTYDSLWVFGFEKSQEKKSSKKWNRYFAELLKHFVYLQPIYDLWLTLILITLLQLDFQSRRLDPQRWMIIVNRPFLNEFFGWWADLFNQNNSFYEKLQDFSEVNFFCLGSCLFHEIVGLF